MNKYKTEPIVTYYYSIKNSPIPLYVVAHSDHKTGYSTSRRDARQFKGWDAGDNQPSIETHDVWKHTEETMHTDEKIDVSQLGVE